MEYINIMEAARRCQVSDKTIRRAIHSGKLAAKYLKHNQCEIAVSDLEAWHELSADQTEQRFTALEQHIATLEQRIVALEAMPVEDQAQIIEDQAEVQTSELKELRAKVADQAQRIEEQTRDISRLYDRLNVEKRYIQERGSKQRGFKAFLKKQPKTPFIEKFLADDFAMPRDTRAHYEYRLGLLHCTEEEQQEFADLWKLMLLQQP